MKRLVLQGGWVVSPDADGVIPDGTVVVEDGIIVEVGTRRYSGPEVVDCRDRVLIPGLCNAHLHSEFLLMKGLLEERRLAEWEDAPFYEKAWNRLEVPVDEALLAPAYRVSYLEQALNGVTFVGEFNCVNGTAPLSESLLEQVGLRGTATFKAVLEPGPSASAVPIYYLHNENSLTVAELEEAAARMRLEPEALFTLHAAETSERMALVRGRFGESTIRLLERYGLLSPQLVLSHAVHVDEEEVALMGRRGTTVVASPTAEMKLADGVSPVPRFLDAGVRVCLGTDCATCNNGADMFLEMKTLGLLHKLTTGAHALPAWRILRMATLDGFRAFGIRDVGLIEPGFRADIVGLDARSTGLCPLIHGHGRSNVFANIVYGATGRDVLDVMVGGSWVVRGGQHRSLRREEATRALQRAAEQLWREVG